MRNAFIGLVFILGTTCSAQVLPSFGNSRTGTAGMQFLKVLPDVRGNSLAGSYIAQANDGLSMFWNPASITQVGKDRLYIRSDQTRYFAGFNLASLGVVYQTKGHHFWGFYS
ncbi:MAG: hypothetical protein LPK45_11635, partial [Bacteroidota bacterium]|nr:hypothetical protein [Bacteroidota bacterium]MDX5431758.1 hypothetical protein [Bacteroidota bacterium]MDX5470473.1 hypothetical protein [Bacteroidota bacterium]